MYQWNRRSFGTDAVSTVETMADGRLESGTAGILAGTRVATAAGWRPAEAIAAGDEVLTFDGGLQVVRTVRRAVLWAGGTGDVAAWPLLVPVGALGNREEMRILPGQAVMVESDAAEEMLGDAFALLPAAALEGVRGICRTRPAERIEVVTLVFDRDEVVFGNSGALFFCPLAADLLSAAYSQAQEGYEVLPFEVALALADGLGGVSARADLGMRATA